MGWPGELEGGRLGWEWWSWSFRWWRWWWLRRRSAEMRGVSQLSIETSKMRGGRSSGIAELQFLKKGKGGEDYRSSLFPSTIRLKCMYVYNEEPIYIWTVISTSPLYFCPRILHSSDDCLWYFKSISLPLRCPLGNRFFKRSSEFSEYMRINTLHSFLIRNDSYPLEDDWWHILGFAPLIRSDQESQTSCV